MGNHGLCCFFYNKRFSSFGEGFLDKFFARR